MKKHKEKATRYLSYAALLTLLITHLPSYKNKSCIITRCYILASFLAGPTFVVVTLQQLSTCHVLPSGRLTPSRTSLALDSDKNDTLRWRLDSTSSNGEGGII
jgi:hypothetical protein